MPENFEKPPLIPNAEGRNEEEKKPILKIIISRHGPKLSAAGEKNAKAAYFNDKVKAGFRQMGIAEENEGLVRIATSPVKRAVDTADIQLNELNQSKHRSKDYVPNKNELAVPFQPENEASDKRFSDDLNTIVNRQKQLEPIIRKAVEHEFVNVPAEEREAEIRNRIDMAVLADFFADNERPEGERNFQTSWEELADGFAKRYAGFSRHSGILEKARSEGGKQPEDEPYVQIDVTHSFPSMAFLKKYLVFKDGQKAMTMTADEFFNRTGGIIPEAGSLELNYEREKGETERIRVSGEFKHDRKFEGDIDLDVLSDP